MLQETFENHMCKKKFYKFSSLFQEAFGSPTARHDNDDPIAAESCEETEAGKYRTIL